MLGAVGVGLAIVLWRGLVKVHARLQAALRDTLESPEAPDTGGGDAHHPDV
jgi:CPA2 family monovalent cation:H+ antiporter-2